jgi:hypothetical protein
MPITGTATVTAKVGPGLTATAMVLNDVHGIDFNFAAGTVAIRYGDPEKTQYFEYTDVATVTFTISAGVSTSVTIST